MGVNRYTSEIKMQARQLFVEKEMTLLEIEAYFKSFFGNDDYPKKSTIANWAHKRDTKGRTWDDYKKEVQEQKLLQMSPEGMARMALQRHWELLNDQSLKGQKLGDALVKSSKTLEKLTDPRMQLQARLQALVDFMAWLKNDKPELVSPDLLEAFREFKNRIFSQISGGPVLSLPEQVTTQLQETAN
jgi:hypothetical protein